jgi:hypothetical protein
VSRAIRSAESILRELAVAPRTPGVLPTHDQILSWRFSDQLRTDPEPRHRPSVATTTPVLAADGSGLAATLATMSRMDRTTVGRAVDIAFPGARLEIARRSGWLDLRRHRPSRRRALDAAERSDGTCATCSWSLRSSPAAAEAPRPQRAGDQPPSGLVGPPASLVAEAATATQVVVVTHARALVEALARHAVDGRRRGDRRRPHRRRRLGTPRRAAVDVAATLTAAGLAGGQVLARNPSPPPGAGRTCRAPTYGRATRSGGSGRAHVGFDGARDTRRLQILRARTTMSMRGRSAPFACRSTAPAIPTSHPAPRAATTSPASWKRSPRWCDSATWGSLTS